MWCKDNRRVKLKAYCCTFFDLSVCQCAYKLCVAIEFVVEFLFCDNLFALHLS